MKLTSQVERVVDFIHRLFWFPKQFELKFQRCQGFSPERIKLWKAKSRISCSFANKILNEIEVIDGVAIRQLILSKVLDRRDIFEDENLYITSFGESAKSGDVVFYDFRHTSDFDKRFKHIDSINILDVPSKSRVVFVDDLVGTGRQSVEFIQKKLLKLLSPSHRPCLFSVCGTISGINRVKETGFEVVCAKELREEEHDFFHSSNETFSCFEKDALKALNAALGRNEFDIGLLIAFYYGTPNNTMPFIWKEGFEYTNVDGQRDRWFALLPRKY